MREKQKCMNGTVIKFNENNSLERKPVDRIRNFSTSLSFTIFFSSTKQVDAKRETKLKSMKKKIIY